MTILEFAAATLAVVLGSVVQVASGVGGGFVIVPFLALLDPNLIPAPLIFASLSLSGLMAMREWPAVIWTYVPITLIGMIPGAVLGAYVLSSVSFTNLGIVFGTVILIGIVLTATGLHLPLTRMTAMLSGALSGVMGTTSGIGAPPLALLYQNEPGPRVRATLAVIYTGATLLMLCILFGFGQFSMSKAYAGVQLMPGFVLGYWIAHRFTTHVDSGWTKIAVLAVSGTAAIALILRSSLIS